MSETPRHVLALWALGLVAVVLLGARYLHHDGGGSAGAAAPIRVGEAESGGSSRLVVHVAGAVRHAGVYRLPAGSRVVDAVRRAGGSRRRADLAALNLAAKLEDGRQVLVPVRGATPAAGGSVAAGGSAAAATPIDLNTATADQLDQLDGIGPGMAASILKYRDQHGGFGSVEELGEVPGIGEKRLASLREQVRV
jgi:competence protein ComEA